MEPIWGWPSGWLGSLEFAPPEVSGSIPSSDNFGGIGPLRLVDYWIRYRVLKKIIKIDAR